MIWTGLASKFKVSISSFLLPQLQQWQSSSGASTASAQAIQSSSPQQLKPLPLSALSNSLADDILGAIPPENFALIAATLREYGTTAVPGPDANPAIVAYFAAASPAQIKSDEVPWCSAFLNAMALRCGLPATRSLAARSWLAIGIAQTTPLMGDIAVFWRDNPQSPFGHVGIFIAERDGLIFLLGGNESNRVQIDAFPSRRLLGFRRLTTA